jgi:hypothetical protein
MTTGTGARGKAGLREARRAAARADLADRGHQPASGLKRLLRSARGQDCASLADQAMMPPLIPGFTYVKGVDYERWRAGSSEPSS